MASVDVFVPCYNYARFLRDSVGSVLSQEGVDVRVLILDDCSTDDSEQVGRALASEDPRVEYRRHAVNRGHIATYNEGIDWLAGDYCLLLSADDVLMPGALARAAAVMDAHPEIGLTHGKAIWTPNPNRDDHQLVVTDEVRIQSGEEFIRTRCAAGHNLVECPTAVGRTVIQKKIGHYRHSLPHSGDMEMWLRYAAHSAVASICAHQAFYRTHGANMSCDHAGVRDLVQIKAAFDSFFAAHESQLAHGPELHRTADQALADNAFGGAYVAFVNGDGAAFKEFRQFARAIDPATRFAPKWLRLCCKRWLGRRTWNALRSCWRGLARRRAPAGPSGVQS